MKTNIQRVWMNATVVQPAQWKDGKDGNEDSGYAVFTVQNVPYVCKLGQKSITLQVFCFGRSGHSVAPFLTVGRQVSLDGQLLVSDQQKIVIVVPSVELIGRNQSYGFDVDAFYSDIEQAELPSQKQQMVQEQQQVQVLDEEDADCEQIRFFLAANNITGDVVQRFYAAELESGRFKNPEAAQGAFCKKLESERFTFRDMSKIVRIANEVMRGKAGKPVSKKSMPNFVEDENGEPVLNTDLFRQEIAKVKPISFEPTEDGR